MASIRDSYPIMFDDAVVPFPLDYYENYDVIDSVKQTEAGTDIVTVARVGKMKATMTIVCTQEVLQTIANFAVEDSFTFKRYDPKIDDYAESVVRMRNFQYSPRKGSEDLTEVKGVWEVSFDLEEF